MGFLERTYNGRNKTRGFLERTYNGRKEKMGKKAQVGETITWLVATIIIIVVLLIFVYASVVLSKTKALKKDIKIDSQDSSFNWIFAKTEIAYSINNQNKNKIEGWIAQENKGDE
jgi:ABC-type Fe3+ transport system permease subunit